MTTIYEKAVMFDAVTGQEVAQVMLNGTKVTAGATLAFSGRMRTFKLQSGSLNEQWSTCQSLELRQDAHSFAVRIAALPAEIGETGFIEFLD